EKPRPAGNEDALAPQIFPQPFSAAEDVVQVGCEKILSGSLYHVFHGARPASHSDSRYRRSRIVSMHCQKPSCLYAKSCPSAASRSMGACSHMTSDSMYSSAGGSTTKNPLLIQPS